MKGLPNDVAGVARELPQRVRLVCATRQSAEAFGEATALGRALARQPTDALELHLFERNTLGLPECYNQAIEAALDDPAVLVFVHDDIWFSEADWIDRLREGLRHFDVIGVAGNVRRLPRQPAWAFVGDALDWDEPACLSGAVGQGEGHAPLQWQMFGPAPRQVQLLDGVLLAASSRTLAMAQLHFDERFRFHFYDMDFCRQCDLKGLRMGTWPLGLVHESGGDFGSPAWRIGLARYRDKWPE
jgi:GT2 family glycosyltransferase